MKWVIFAITAFLTQEWIPKLLSHDSILCSIEVSIQALNEVIFPLGEDQRLVFPLAFIPQDRGGTQ